MREVIQIADTLKVAVFHFLTRNYATRINVLSDSSAYRFKIMNICDLIVRTRPDRVQAVEQGLLDLPSVEIHGGRAEGKLVVTVEDTDQSEVADTLAPIKGVAGVINTVLIYHYGGDDLAEEVDHESHSA